MNAHLRAEAAGAGDQASTGALRSHRSPLRLGLAIVLGAGILLTTLATGAAVLLDHGRSAAEAAAARALERTAEVVEHAVNRHLLQADSALISLPALLGGAPGPAAEARLDAAAAGRLLRALNSQTFAFRNLMLVRPDGTIWASARPYPPQTRVPVDGVGPAGAALAFAGPRRNRLTGSWDLLLERRIAVPGQDELIAVAEQPLPSLAMLLEETGRPAGAHIILTRGDNSVLVGVPYDEAEIGHLLSGPGTAGPASGVAVLPHGKGDITVLRSTLYRDIHITVRLATKLALQDWRRDRTRVLAGLAIATSLVIAFTAALCAALRQRDRLDQDRRTAHSVLDSAIDAMSVGFVIWDKDDRLISCNQRFRDLYDRSTAFIRPGATFEAILRGGVANGQYPTAGADTEAFIRDVLHWHRHDGRTMERLLPDGRWVLSSEKRTPDGRSVGIRFDVTSLRRALSDLEIANAWAKAAMSEVRAQNQALATRDQALATQNRLFDAALNNMSHGLLMTDADARVIVCSSRFCEMFGIAADAATAGVSADSLFDRIEGAGVFDGDVVADLRRGQTRLAERRQAGSFVVRGPDGRALSIAQRPLDEGGWVAIYEDVTERLQAESRIRFLAHHDPLTGLANRVELRRRMAEMLQAPMASDRRVALLYIDLDKFKDVNDGFGHAAGDELLLAAATRLAGCVREGDVVARLGGDEFAVACTAMDPERFARGLGERMIEVLSAPYRLGEISAVVGASIGVAIAGDGETEPDLLLKRADLALYEAKAAGRGVCRSFHPALAQRLDARLEMEAELRAAIERSELDVVYQPIVDLRTTQILGYEALVRWHHPRRGELPATAFVPLAEESGMIMAVGSFVLRRACQEMGGLGGEARIAVNLSPVQLRNEAILATVAGALATSGLAPHRLELEITESALLRDNERMIGRLHQLRGLGVRIVLADFGTGFSALSHLRSFPFDKLKIDRTFVREMADRKDCAAIVHSAVMLADRLGMITTAEGVETPQQLAAVRAAGCVEAQGFLLGAPAPLPGAAAPARKTLIDAA